MHFISLCIDYQAAKLSLSRLKAFRYVIKVTVCLLNEKYYRTGETFGLSSRSSRRIRSRVFLRKLPGEFLQRKARSGSDAVVLFQEKPGCSAENQRD